MDLSLTSKLGLLTIEECVTVTVVPGRLKRVFFCQVKKNPKIREKLGSGWVVQAPTRIFILLGKFCVFCVIFMFPKKMDRGVGRWDI